MFFGRKTHKKIISYQRIQKFKIHENQNECAKRLLQLTEKYGFFVVNELQKGLEALDRIVYQDSSWAVACDQLRQACAKVLDDYFKVTIEDQVPKCCVGQKKQMLYRANHVIHAYRALSGHSAVTQDDIDRINGFLGKTPEEKEEVNQFLKDYFRDRHQCAADKRFLKFVGDIIKNKELLAGGNIDSAIKGKKLEFDASADLISKNINIMHVDDDLSLHKFITKFSSDLGLEGSLYQYYDGRSALTHISLLFLKDELPDLVILDNSMDFIKGEVLGPILATLFPKMCLFGNTGDTADFLFPGVIGWIGKPITIDNFKGLLNFHSKKYESSDSSPSRYTLIRGATRESRSSSADEIDLASIRDKDTRALAADVNYLCRGLEKRDAINGYIDLIIMKYKGRLEKGICPRDSLMPLPDSRSSVESKQQHYLAIIKSRVVQMEHRDDLGKNELLKQVLDALECLKGLDMNIPTL